MASRIRPMALVAGLIAATALAVSGNPGPGKAWAQATRQAPGATRAKEAPPFKHLEVRLLARPKGEQNARLVISTATIARMPKTITYSTGDADLVLKSGKEHPDVYSTLFHIDVANLRDQASAELEFLQANTFPPPPRRSARFGLLPSRGSSALPPEVAIANIRAGLSDFDNLEFRKAPEITVMKLVLLGGDIGATLFGHPVPVDTFNNLSQMTLDSQIAPERSLMITDLDVVADPTRTYDLCGNVGSPNGAWTFKHVMTAMTNQPMTGMTPEQFTWNWLTTFASAQNVNNNPSAARPAFVSVVRDQWLANSGGVTLDLNKAPFRLLAIVARPDIHGTPGGYGSASAGEARLVFGILDPASPCSVKQSTVIFEYAIHKPNCLAVKAWNQAWADLSNPGLTMGPGGSFNTHLQTLTESFVGMGADSSMFPNQSAISQVRVNDLIGGPWTLYEFALDQSNLGGMGQLNRSTVKMTPDISFHTDPSKIAELAAYITANATDIVAGTNFVPVTTAPPGSTPFLGAEAPEGLPPPNFTWTNTPFASPPASPTAVFQFSVHTCNGCHTGDGKGAQGQPTAFTHIKPRPANLESTLSGFVFDPSNSIFFEDDLERRQAAMAAVLNASCMTLPIINDQLIDAQD